MSNVLRLILKHWPLSAALASAAMLATAHAFETFGGYAPCTLCLRQREVYWAALAIGMTGWIAPRVLKGPPLAQIANWLLAAAFAIGAAVAIYHAGAEWKFWPGPQACASAGSAAISAADMAALLAGEKVRAPACDEAAWVFAGLSMAGWNALASLSLSALSLGAARRKGTPS